MKPKSLLFKAASAALVALLFALFSPDARAQVTSSTITGRVADSKGELLPGATIVAIHVPSGTKYGTVTNEKGLYTIPGVRVGGPYAVTASFVGFGDQTKENIFAELGTSADVSFSMAENGTELQEVVISTARSDIFSSDRTGAASSFGRETSTRRLQSAVRSTILQSTILTETVSLLPVRMLALTILRLTDLFLTTVLDLVRRLRQAGVREQQLFHWTHWIRFRLTLLRSTFVSRVYGCGHQRRNKIRNQ